LEKSDEELVKEFRMTRAVIENICELVHDKMQPTGCRFADLSLKQKVLLSLKTLGSRSLTSKDFLKVTQPTVSKILTQFVDAVTEKAFNYIYMPRNTKETAKTKKDFFKLSGFPGIVGCVDGSHIPLIAPKEDEFVSEEAFIL